MTLTKHTTTLTIHSARNEDVYKDVARISKKDRVGLRTGRVYRFTVNGRSGYFVLRGMTNKKDGHILIDGAMRDRLGIEYGQNYAFEIAELGFFRELWWGWGATDPVVRASARVGVISLGLGVLSVMLGALGFWLALRSLPMN
jgi:hypothetical protein